MQTASHLLPGGCAVEALFFAFSLRNVETWKKNAQNVGVYAVQTSSKWHQLTMSGRSNVGTVGCCGCSMMPCLRCPALATALGPATVRDQQQAHSCRVPQLYQTLTTLHICTYIYYGYIHIYKLNSDIIYVHITCIYYIFALYVSMHVYNMSMLCVYVMCI